MLSKSSLLIVGSIIFLALSALFSYNAKSNFLEESKRVKAEIVELKETKDLQKLWQAKGMKSKLEKALNSFKTKNIRVDRKKAVISAANLTDLELNKMLNKLASLPVQFKELKIDKSDKNFNLECKCVW